MQTGTPSSVSRSLKPRPSTTGRSSVRKYAWLDNLVVGSRTLALVHRRVAHDLEKELALVDSARAAARSSRPHCDARKGHNFLLHGVEELQQRRRSGIARPQRIDQHRQHALGAIPAVDILHGEQRAQQQAGAEEQQYGGRDFADDEQASQCSAAPRNRPAVGGYQPAPARSWSPATPERGQTAPRRASAAAAQNGDDAHVESERHRRGKQALRNQRGCDAQNRGADAHSQ